MYDQADKLRNLVLRAKARLQPSGPPPRLVVFTGGKGGVGTTTLAINVSVALAQLGKRVVLVDADLHRGDIAALCGLHEDYSVADVMSARRTVHEVLQRGPAGIQVVPGAWAPNKPLDSSPVAQQRLIQQLKALGRHADMVLLDVGSGAGQTIQRYWQAADRVLLISTADPVSIMDTYATIKVLAGESAASTVEIVVNRVADAEQADLVYQRIDASCRRFLGHSTKDGGYVTVDPKLAESRRAGGPLLIDGTHNPAAQGIARIAAILAADPGHGTRTTDQPQRHVA